MILILVPEPIAIASLLLLQLLLIYIYRHDRMIEVLSDKLRDKWLFFILPPCIGQGFSVDENG